MELSKEKHWGSILLFMRKENKSTKYNPDPLLKMNDFEEAALAILDLTQDKILMLLEEAKKKREESVEEAKQSFCSLKNEYLEKTEAEIKLEKEKLLLEVEEKLKVIASISQEKVKQAVNYVVEKTIPK